LKDNTIAYEVDIQFRDDSGCYIDPIFIYDNDHKEVMSHHSLVILYQEGLMLHHNSFIVF
jgi:hypothetical protein